MTPVFKLTINGQTYDVNVGDLTASPVTVTVDGVDYQVDLPSGTAAPTPAPSATPARPAAPRPQPAPAPSASPAPAAASSGNTIDAPIPGRILSVLVSVGDTVTSGQGVVVMESMKMEQTIASPRDGVVKQVLVGPGDAAAYGQQMVILE